MVTTLAFKYLKTSEIQLNPMGTTEFLFVIQIVFYINSDVV